MRPRGFTCRASDGMLVITERNSRLVRLDPLTGTPLWETHVDNAHGTIALGEDRCVYLNQRGSLTCVDLESGNIRWSTGSRRFNDYVSIVDDVVLIGGWRGYRPVQAFDVTSGRPLWVAGSLNSSQRSPTPSFGQTFDNTVWPQPIAGGILTSIRGGLDLWLADPQTGKRVAHWTLPEPIAGRDHAPVFSVTPDGRVTFQCGLRKIAILDMTKGVEVVWEHPHDLPIRLPLLNGNDLWLADHQALSRVSVETSTLQQSIPLPETAVNRLVLVDGAIAAASASGLLLIITQPDDTTAQRVVSKRAVNLDTAAENLLHIASKSEIIGATTRN